MNATKAQGLLRPARAGQVRAYSHIHNSRLPTYFYQPGLQRLPIPKLEDTLAKYLMFLRPIVNDAQYAEAKAAAEAFGAPSGPGQKLHTHLLEWDKQHQETSYISAMWYDMYLKNRDALPLNLNPQLTWRDPKVFTPSGVPGTPEPWDLKAARLVHAAVRFHLALEAQVLRPDVFSLKPDLYNAGWFQTGVSLLPPKLGYYAAAGLAQSYPLDMSQYPRLFKSTRVPKRGKDELTTAPGKIRHIVIQRGPRFYTLEVIKPDGTPVPVSDVQAGLRGIAADSDGARGSSTYASDAGGVEGAAYAKEAPVGALTGWGRDEWADARAKLESSSPLNKASLAAIDSALFMLTVDDSTPRPEQMDRMSRTMLHGDARNRWFDKCFNLIVTTSGAMGVNWEHAWGDGSAVLYFFNECFKMMQEDNTAGAAEGASVRVAGSSATGAVSSAAGPVSLAWDLKAHPDVLPAIRAAEAYSDKVISSTDLFVNQTDIMTKDDIKRSGLSPDGLMQMVMQLGHWRAHGFTPSTYESASTAAFKHGRTETIRVASPESVELCKAFTPAPGASATPSDAELVARYEALSKASARHRKTTLECVMGKGVDRHLFALQKWAEMAPELLGPGAPNPPALFTTPAHAAFKDIRLSTSTLASDALEGGGFGPVSLTSYGVGYGVEKRGTHFHIMSYKGATTNCKDFETACWSALKDIVACINAAKAAGKIVKQQ